MALRSARRTADRARATFQAYQRRPIDRIRLEDATALLTCIGPMRAERVVRAAPYWQAN